MQTDSELESDTSSINGDGAPGSMANPSSIPLSKESLDKRIESLVQENRVLKMEIGRLFCACNVEESKHSRS